MGRCFTGIRGALGDRLRIGTPTHAHVQYALDSSNQKAETVA